METKELLKVILILKKRYDKTYKIIFTGDYNEDLYVEIYKGHQLIESYCKCDLEQLLTIN